MSAICELRNALQAAPAKSGIQRISVPCTEAPLALLNGTESDDRIYWRPRDGQREVAGIGCAQLVTSFEDLTPADGSRFYGGLAFGPASTPPWDRLGAWRFVLPRFELDGHELACNLVDGDVANALEELEALRFGVADLLPACVSQRDMTGREQWMSAVSEALDSIAAGELTKVVLARRIRLSFASAPSPAALVTKLVEAAGACFVFLLETNGVAFLGASPERLYRRDGNQLETEALAGTCPRSDDPERDAELASALLNSEKERREHRNVVDGLARALQELGCEFHSDEAPSLRRLPRVQHLYQHIQCPLPDGVGDAELVGALHPTSAVGGDPRQAALKLIDELEPFDRGWYAGLVGAVGADDADFAVAIRSALLQGAQADLFGGAGIVAGSEPASEWEETVDKMAWLTRGIFAGGDDG